MKVKSNTTVLWQDTKGLLSLIFIENKFGIEGKNNLYFEIGNTGSIIHIMILANDLIGLLNQWAEMKIDIFSKAGIDLTSQELKEKK